MDHQKCIAVLGVDFVMLNSPEWKGMTVYEELGGKSKLNKQVVYHPLHLPTPLQSEG